MKDGSVLITTSARTGLKLVYVFCSEISCHLPGNVRDILLLHQEQPPFAEVHSLRYKKNHKKIILSLSWEHAATAQAAQLPPKFNRLQSEQEWEHLC